MTDQELLAEIKKAKLVDNTTATRLERETLLSGKPLEEIIARGKLADSSKLAELKSALLKVPYKKIDVKNYDDKLLDLIPEETARTYGTVALGTKDNLLVLGMV